MQVIDRAEADRLLMPLGIKIGNWNELCSQPSVGVANTAYSPPSDAMDLYVAAFRLAEWIASGSWTLLQVDNSTSPTDDEIAVFEKLILANQTPWKLADDHTFLLSGEARKSTLVLLIYFALLFAWHIHLTSENSSCGQRLALQDGVVYFFGDAIIIQGVDALVKKMADAPRALHA
jgi:hypothetical protein